MINRAHVKPNMKSLYDFLADFSYIFSLMNVMTTRQISLTCVLNPEGLKAFTSSIQEKTVDKVTTNETRTVKIPQLIAVKRILLRGANKVLYKANSEAIRQSTLRSALYSK